MSKIILCDVDEFLDKVKKSKAFTSKEDINGLSLRYNEIFTTLGNPKIKLIKLSNTELKVKLLPNAPMIALAIFVAVFFWGIMLFAILNHKNIVATIISGFAPSVMWFIELGFLKGMKKIILGELNAIKKQGE